MFVRDDKVIIGIYVDDLLILIPKRMHDLMKQIKKDLKREFKIKKFSEIQKILDIRIVRRRSERAVYFN